MTWLRISYLAALLVAGACGLFAAASSTASPARSQDRSPASRYAAAVSTVTGIAITPLLGTGVYGAYQWFSAPDEAARAALPWYAQWTFFVPALLLVGACAAKDAMGATVPTGLKKPLDVAELLENKLSGLVAAGAVIPITMSTVADLAFGGGTASMPGVANSGMAMVSVGAIDLSWLAGVATMPFAVAVFAVVWMASHAINVLILLSPWGAIDAALKAARTALLGVLTLTSSIDPMIGALLSLGVILVAWLIAGWSFRLTVFGSVFCWDFFTGRQLRFEPQADANWMFSAARFSGVPVRTYGRLITDAEGRAEFEYRPWLVAATRRAKVEAGASGLAVGQGLFLSNISDAGENTIFLLPPRYRGHEALLARNQHLGLGVRPAGLRKAWSALGELFGGRPSPGPS